MPTLTEPVTEFDLSLFNKKPSVIMKIALDDLEACEKDPRYQIVMDTCHEAYEDKCCVCMAGAVLAKSLGADIKFNAAIYFAHRFENPSPLYGYLRAIDSFRQGYLAVGLMQLNVDIRDSKIPAMIYVPPYQTQPAAFKVGILRVISTLQQHDL